MVAACSTLGDAMGMKEVGRVVRQAREARGLSQRQLGQSAGISHTYVSKIEGGESKGLGYDVLRNVAATLGIQAAELEALLYDRPLPTPVAGAPTMPIAVPILATASAGRGGGHVEQWAFVPYEQGRGRVLRAYRASGVCMEPEIGDGDTVIVDCDASPQDGEIVAAINQETGDFLIKRYFRANGSVELVPEQGEPVVLPEDQVRIEGVVIQVNRKPSRRRRKAAGS